MNLLHYLPLSLGLHGHHSGGLRLGPLSGPDRRPRDDQALLESKGASASGGRCGKTAP